MVPGMGLDISSSEVGVHFDRIIPDTYHYLLPHHLTLALRTTTYAPRSPHPPSPP